MRFAFVIVSAALALGACGQQGAPGDAPAAGAAQTASMGSFPSLTGASYRLEATVTHTDGTAFPVVMQRDGLKMRMEFKTGEGDSAIISDGATGESLVLIRAAGRTIAMRADANVTGQGPSDPTADWQGELAQKATRTGSCSVAGETGGEWTSTEGGDTQTACVTDDGVILSATQNGRTIWQTTAVQRKPQPASAFELPPGVEVMDLGNLGGMVEQMRQRGGQ